MSNQLSPIERIIRNATINYLFKSGFTVNSIARVMNMTQSTVSRVVHRDDNKSLTDIVPLDE